MRVILLQPPAAPGPALWFLLMLLLMIPLFLLVANTDSARRAGSYAAAYIAIGVALMIWIIRSTP